MNMVRIKNKEAMDRRVKDVAQKELLVVLEDGSGYLLQRKLNGKVGIIAEVIPLLEPRGSEDGNRGWDACC